MRLRIEQELARSADEIFRFAAANAVASTPSGHWVDGARPVDTAALKDVVRQFEQANHNHMRKPDRELLEEKGRRVEAEQRSTRVTHDEVLSGTIEWSDRRLLARTRTGGALVAARIDIESVGPLAAAVRCTLKVRPDRRLTRVAVFLGGPGIRWFVRRKLLPKALADFDIAAMSPFPPVPHDTATWTYCPESHGERRSA